MCLATKLNECIHTEKKEYLDGKGSCHLAQSASARVLLVSTMGEAKRN